MDRLKQLQARADYLENEIDKRDDRGLSKKDLLDELEEVYKEMDKLKETETNIPETKPSDYSFEYQLLDRLRSDCDYYLGAGGRSDKNLWAGNPEGQIAKMKELWNELPEKPEWLSMEDIEAYEKEMIGDDKVQSGNAGKRFKRKATTLESVKDKEECEPDNDKLSILGALRSDLIDEYSTITNYEDHIKMLRDLGYQDEANVLEDIVEEEKVHVGQLQALLNITDCSYETRVEEGEQEAKDQLDNNYSEEPETPEITPNLNVAEGVTNDPQDILTESAVFGENDVEDKTDYAGLLEKYYGKEAKELAESNKLSAKAVYFYMECHAAFDPVSALKEELENDFNKEEFTKLYE